MAAPPEAASGHDERNGIGQRPQQLILARDQADHADGVLNLTIPRAGKLAAAAPNGRRPSAPRYEKAWLPD